MFELKGGLWQPTVKGFDDFDSLSSLYAWWSPRLEKAYSDNDILTTLSDRAASFHLTSNGAPRWKNNVVNGHAGVQFPGSSGNNLSNVTNIAYFNKFHNGSRTAIIYAYKPDYYGSSVQYLFGTNRIDSNQTGFHCALIESANLDLQGIWKGTGDVVIYTGGLPEEEDLISDGGVVISSRLYEYDIIGDDHTHTVNGTTVTQETQNAPTSDNPEFHFKMGETPPVESKWEFKGLIFDVVLLDNPTAEEYAFATALMTTLYG